MLILGPKIAGPTSGRLLSLQKQMQMPGDFVSTNVNGTAETVFASSQVSVPANTLQVGQSITIRAHLTFTQASLGPTQRPRIRLGSSLLIDAGDLGLLANVANARAYVECTFNVRAIGTNGSIEAAGMLTFTNQTSGQAVAFLAGPSGSGGESGNPVAVNTTITQTLAMSTQYANTMGSNNTILRQCRIFTEYPMS